MVVAYFLFIVCFYEHVKTIHRETAHARTFIVSSNVHSTWFRVQFMHVRPDSGSASPTVRSAPILASKWVYAHLAFLFLQ